MPKTSASVGFGLIDVTAKKDTTATISDAQDFINPQDLSLDGVYPEPFATLETDYWKLDGTFEPFPDEPQKNSWGVWSNRMSGADGGFAVPPVLTLVFTDLHESAGLTFEFCPYGDNYCNHLNIKWYVGDSLLDEKEVYPNCWRYGFENKVSGYNKIILTFYSTNNPDRYLKIQNIQHGINKYFTEGELEEVSVLEEIDLSALELSINTLDFSVRSDDNDFDIFNPQGMYDLLQKKQQLYVDGNRDGVLTNYGYYYVDTWDNSAGITKIVAQDAIGIMDSTNFVGGMYTNKPVTNLIDEIMNSAGFGYSLDGSFAETTVSGWLPYCTHREALQQVAFAIGAYVDTSRGGMIKLRAWPNAETNVVLGRDRKKEGTEVSLREYVSAVNITEHSYTLSTALSELYNGELPVGQSEIVFSNPATSLTIEGGTIVKSGVNYCIVNVASAGTVLIKGRRYTDNKKIVNIVSGHVEPGEKENVKSIEDATLISSHNSKAAATRLILYYQKRIEQNIGFVVDSESPGLSVNVEVNPGIYKSAVIESMETDLANGFVTKAVVVGE